MTLTPSTGRQSTAVRLPGTDVGAGTAPVQYSSTAGALLRSARTRSEALRRPGERKGEASGLSRPHESICLAPDSRVCLESDSHIFSAFWVHTARREPCDRGRTLLLLVTAVRAGCRRSGESSEAASAAAAPSGGPARYAHPAPTVAADGGSPALGAAPRPLSAKR